MADFCYDLPAGRQGFRRNRSLEAVDAVFAKLKTEAVAGAGSRQNSLCEFSNTPRFEGQAINWFARLKCSMPFYPRYQLQYFRHGPAYRRKDVCLLARATAVSPTPFTSDSNIKTKTPLGVFLFLVAGAGIGPASRAYGAPRETIP
ncbi:MAG: hypothetical protein LiPW15_438 [Parcubacteria group bacterium LiPW_15]|nr:MAG: hypothetical protein LiPW15_438 [Parcubacteria group bacterium LiPW_15]